MSNFNYPVKRVVTDYTFNYPVKCVVKDNTFDYPVLLTIDVKFKMCSQLVDYPVILCTCNHKQRYKENKAKKGK